MDELDRLTFEYNQRFDEGFPMFQLCRDRPEDECVEIVKRCLSERKTAYQLGLVTADDKVKY